MPDCLLSKSILARSSKWVTEGNYSIDHTKNLVNVDVIFRNVIW